MSAMRVRRGAMDQKIEILRPTKVAVSGGSRTEKPGTPEIIAECWASFEKLGSGESETSRKIYQEGTWLVRMDYLPGLTSKDSIRRVEDDSVYKIDGIEDEELRHVTHVLTVAKVS